MKKNVLEIMWEDSLMKVVKNGNYLYTDFKPGVCLHTNFFTTFDAKHGSWPSAIEKR